MLCGRGVLTSCYRSEGRRAGACVPAALVHVSSLATRLRRLSHPALRIRSCGGQQLLCAVATANVVHDGTMVAAALIMEAAGKLC